MYQFFLSPQHGDFLKNELSTTNLLGIHYVELVQISEADIWN